MENAEGEQKESSSSGLKPNSYSFHMTDVVPTSARSSPTPRGETPPLPLPTEGSGACATCSQPNVPGYQFCAYPASSSTCRF